MLLACIANDDGLGHPENATVGVLAHDLNYPALHLTQLSRLGARLNRGAPPPHTCVISGGLSVLNVASRDGTIALWIAIQLNLTQLELPAVAGGRISLFCYLDVPKSTRATNLNLRVYSSVQGVGPTRALGGVLSCVMYQHHSGASGPYAVASTDYATHVGTEVFVDSRASCQRIDNHKRNLLAALAGHLRDGVDHPLHVFGRRKVDGSMHDDVRDIADPVHLPVCPDASGEPWHAFSGDVDDCAC
jgi:hypothetical protein